MGINKELLMHMILMFSRLKYRFEKAREFDPWKSTFVVVCMRLVHIALRLEPLR